MLRALVLLLLIGFRTNAQSGFGKDLPGLWKVEKWSANGHVLYHSQLGEPKIEFNPQGGYMISVSGQKETGIYTIKKSELVLRSVDPNDKTTFIQIQSLGADTMVYLVKSDSIPALISLRKIAPPWTEAEEREREREEKEQAEKRRQDSTSDKRKSSISSSPKTP